MTGVPFIPSTITVHMGAPTQAAENVTVSFPDYIKNVASSEIYPTWPENSLRANIYAIISYALNRVYTEWYHSQGYNFDITNSTAYDMSFVKNRNIFEDISRITDEIFNDYIRRQGFIEPLFAAFCDGIEVQCDGLSQWGSVDLANEGRLPYEILTYYYGDNIDIVDNAPIQNISDSFKGTLLRLGSQGQAVQRIQLQLNRISTDYPLIPKIPEPDGIFGVATENAVKAFQRTFNLAEDGIVGKSTWYKIQYIFTAVTDLAELESEGLTISDLPRQFDRILAPGDRGIAVRSLQYLLSTISFYNSSVSPLVIDGIYGPSTESSVRGFQSAYGLTPTGIVSAQTGEKIIDVYLGIIEKNPPDYINDPFAIFPGTPLRLGSSGEAVTALQERLNIIADFYPSIERVVVNGYFGPETQRAVIEFEREFGLPQRGIVVAFVWERIGEVSRSLEKGNLKNTGQFPGYNIKY